MKQKIKRKSTVAATPSKVAVIGVREEILLRIGEQKNILSSLKVDPSTELAVQRVDQLHMQIANRLYAVGFENDIQIPFMLNECGHLLDKIKTLPLAVHGAEFPSGRRPGAYGAVRKAIEGILDKGGNDLMPAAVWERLKSKPPRDWEFREKFIDLPGGDIDRKIFGNLVGKIKLHRRTKS
jgi:hypothetical protein